MGVEVVDSFHAGVVVVEAHLALTRQKSGLGPAPDLSGNAEALSFEALMEQTWRIIPRTEKWLPELWRKSNPTSAHIACL